MQNCYCRTEVIFTIAVYYFHNKLVVINKILRFSVLSRSFIDHDLFPAIDFLLSFADAQPSYAPALLWSEEQSFH